VTDSSTSRHVRRLLAGLGIFLPMMLSHTVAAASLQRSTVSGATLNESSGHYTLSATVGEVGVVGLVQGDLYTLGCGFWQGFANVFVPVGAPPAFEVLFQNGLRQNFPNPFSTETSIAYSVGTKSPVRLTIYDVAGRRVRSLVNAELDPGRYVRRWQGRDDHGQVVASGVYFCRLDVGAWTETRRMLRLH